MDSRESPLRLSDSGRHPAALAHRRDMRVEVDLRAEPVGMVLGARHLRREGVAYLRGRIAGHRPGRRGVPLFRHGVGNEKTECLMRKQEYKEQERPRRYYFFDYLFWLGEMAQQHYKGEPRRPDGDSMLMLCIMVVVLGPIITIVLCFDPPVRDFLAIAMIICSVVIVYLPGRIYSPARRKAVMRHYAGRKFSPARCYFFLFSLGFLLIANIPLWGTVLKWIDKTIK